MGFMCSWIAIRTDAKAEVLDYLGFVEGDQLTQPATGEWPFSAHQGDDGWLYIFAEDFDWATADRTRDLSQFGLAIGVQYEDKVEMTTVAVAAEDGEELWSVSHSKNPAKGLLDVTGQPPEEFEEIRRKWQAEDERAVGSADYLLEIPLELASVVSGYRVDEDSIEFVALKPRGRKSPALQSGAGDTSNRGERPQGLFARLRSLFGG